MRAHLVQSDIAWEDKQENYRRVAAMLDAARPAPGDLAVLPEMFDTGFSFNLAVTADRDDATLNFLKDLAKKHQITLQGARSVMGPDGKGRNRASIIAPDGSLLAEYDKIHPFSFGRENELFAGGDTVVVYPWRSGGGGGGGASGGAAAEHTTVCPAICYDIRFPELFRLGMKQGAEILALGANWPAPRALHRSVLSQARAIENQAIMLSVNRVGRDPNIVYAGGTAAYGPKGEVLGQLGEEPGVLSVQIDLAALREWRKQFPATRDVKLI